ncbi:class I SAM-dependent methyltransferase [Candidatus Woesearchaeota archaeon]|nr:class I SAM-dependent methyltransferase [Candidatus Woesearchaeota archaeon]
MKSLKIITNEMKDYLDETIKTYNEIADDYAQNIEPYPNINELDKFSSMLSKNSAVLDVGCAAGRDSIILQKKGFKVTGIDLSEKLINLANAKTGKIKFIKIDMRKLSFSKNYFDGIWANASIIHLNYNDASLTVKKFFRVLKNKGILYISVKKGKGKTEVVEKLSLGKKRVFYFYEETQLKKLIQDAGFNIVEAYVRNSKLKRKLNWICVFAQKNK